MTTDRHVKILDFGLAKRTDSDMPSAGGETQTALTHPGLVVGTVGYMSPEQIRGKSIDTRSDIFSFGCVLYEMLAGARAFDAGSGVETMTAILRQEPRALTKFSHAISPALAAVVARCLEKNAADRFQSARDPGFAIEAVSTLPASAERPARRAHIEARGASLFRDRDWRGSRRVFWTEIARRNASAFPPANVPSRVRGVGAVFPGRRINRL